MIYEFTIRNERNEDKLFYLTEDNHNKLFKRIQHTYGIPKEKVNILREFKETKNGYKLLVSHVEDLTEEDKLIQKKSKEIFSKQTKKCDPWKTEYKEKYKFKEEITINSEKDLYELLKKYKTIKVYWENGEKRGVHRYYALCK